MSVTYEAVLDVSEDGVAFVSGLLDVERRRRGTRTGARRLSIEKQAVLVLRWFLDDTRMAQLARDNAISTSTAYEYRDEGIEVLAARQPSLHGVLLAAKAAGHSHVIVDGTPIYTDRNHTPGPTPSVDLWWSGKHRHHGGNIQVVSAPDGWPLWTSDVRPGREHDTTAARADPELLTQITEVTPFLRTDGRPADLQRRPRRPALPRRTRKLPDQDHLQGAAPPLPRLPLAPGPDRRSRTGPAPPREQPDHMITKTQSRDVTRGYAERLLVRMGKAGAETGLPRRHSTRPVRVRGPGLVGGPEPGPTRPPLVRPALPPTAGLAR